MVLDPSIPVPPSKQQPDWLLWAFRLTVGLFFTVLVWMVNRGASTLDDYGKALYTLQTSMSALHVSIDATSRQNDALLALANAALADHESRLRQDRELLVQIGTRLTEQGSRVLTLEELTRLGMRGPPTSTPRR